MRSGRRAVGRGSGLINKRWLKGGRRGGTRGPSAAQALAFPCCFPWMMSSLPGNHLVII